MGEALLVGRRMYKSDKLFGKWIKENGFGDMDRTTRSAAMWWADAGFTAKPFCSTDDKFVTNYSHPTHVRIAYNEWLKSQAAWRKLKETAAEQRELWRQVGEALLVGRRMYKSNNLFGKWVKENGFGDIQRQYRYAAMWLAENWDMVTDSVTVSSDPIQLHKAYNEWLKSQEDAKASHAFIVGKLMLMAQELPWN